MIPYLIPYINPNALDNNAQQPQPAIPQRLPNLTQPPRPPKIRPHKRATLHRKHQRMFRSPLNRKPQHYKNPQVLRQVQQQ